MKYSLILLISLSLNTWGESGFYSSDDAKLSAPVREASKSVFEIRAAFVSDLENFTDVSVVDLSTEAKRKSVIEDINRSSDSRERIILRAFVDNCLQSNSIEECAIPRSFSSGSGFITGNGNKVWTNYHVMEKTLNTRSATHEKKLSDVISKQDNFPIFIFDRDGNLVFNGLQQQLSFIDLPRPTLLSQASKTIYSVDNDYISFSLPKSLGAPLSISAKPIVEGQRLSIIGYPYCTGCPDPSGSNDLSFADRNPGQNAGDCIENTTIGQALNPDQWGELAQVNEQLIRALDRSQFIGTTADSQHGMSGGPILNQQGEVIAINAGSKAIKRNNQNSFYSRGVVPPNFK